MAPKNLDVLRSNFIYGVSYRLAYLDTTELKTDFTIIATCCIDTAGNVIRLHFDKHDYPVALGCIAEKINATSGQWLPAIRDCHLVISDTVTFIFRKKYITAASKNKNESDSDKLFKSWYYFLPVTNDFLGWGYKNEFVFDLILKEPEVPAQK